MLGTVSDRARMLLTSELYCTGGMCRVCLLEEESVLVAGTMRNSGDLGLIDEDGQLHYLGREDRQVKRWGTKVSLELIQQVCQLFPNYCAFTGKAFSRFHTGFVDLGASPPIQNNFFHALRRGFWWHQRD